MSVISRQQGNGISLNIRLISGAAAGLVWWGLQYLPVRANGSIGGVGDICPFRTFTGLPCPLCGMTRSLLCFVQGNWIEAMRWHPLGISLGMAIAASLVIWLIGQANLITLVSQYLPISVRTSGLLLIALVYGTWILRLANIFPLPPSP